MIDLNEVLRVQVDDDGSFSVDMPGRDDWMFNRYTKLSEMLDVVFEGINQHCFAKGSRLGRLEREAELVQLTRDGLIQARLAFSSIVTTCLAEVEVLGEAADEAEERLRKRYDSYCTEINNARHAREIALKDSAGICQLLEQRQMVGRACHILEVEHPLEQFFGPIKCVAFRPYKDIDGDGDLDFAPVYYGHKQIKA